MPAMKATMAGAAALALFSTLPTVKADSWDQKTTFNFPTAVEVPGRVLPAGAYVFKLVESPANRQIVQISTPDEKHVLGTFLAIPDYRNDVPSRPMISFQERGAGSPEAVRSWFYPGEHYGHQFLYSKAEPMPAVAEALPAVPDPMPAPPDIQEKTEPAAEAPAPAVIASAPAPAAAEAPAAKPDVDEVVAIEEVPDPFAGKLPSTASSTPLVGLLGLMSLGVAGVLRRVARATR